MGRQPGLRPSPRGVAARARRCRDTRGRTVIQKRVPAAPTIFVVAAAAWAATGSWMAPVSAVGTLVAVAALMERASQRRPEEITSSAERDRTHRGRTGSYVWQQLVSPVCLGAGSCTILARMQYDGAADE